LTQLDHRASDEEQDKLAVKKDAIVQDLLTKRPAQIDTWMDNNVTDLTSARNVLKVLTRIIVALLRKELQ